MTPDEQRFIEEYMAREKNRENRTIDGFKCTKYVLKRDGKATESIWTTNDIKVADDFHKDAEKLSVRLGSRLGTEHPFSRLLRRGYPGIRTLDPGRIYQSKRDGSRRDLGGSTEQ